MNLNLESKVVVASDHLASDLPDETIVLSLRAGTYFGVNGVARDIWQMIQKPVAVGDVRDSLVQRYGVPKAEIERDLLAFLGELEANQLLTVEPA